MSNQTPPAAVPAGFRMAGPAPDDDNEQTCKVCALRYSDHTGHTCAICGQAVEHHGPGTRGDFGACLAGRQRMAAARVLAGVPLDEVDRLALTERVTP